MNDHLRIGVLPATGVTQLGDPAGVRHLVELAREAERLGFASFWANDSLASARVEPLALLSAIAATTERITLGTAALIPAYRTPVQAAQLLTTLDLLAAGRLVLGVGAGFPVRSDPDFALAGIPTARRSARLDEIVALWRQLWSATGPSSFHGELLHHDTLPDQLAPHRPGGPPLWLAAGNPAALRRAGSHYDGWLPYPPSPEEYRTGLTEVRSAAAAAGRDPDAVTPALFATVAVAPDQAAGRALLARYCMSTYGAPVEHVETIQTLIGGPAEHVAAEIGRFADAGARHVVVRLTAIEPGSQRLQLERVADALLASAAAAA